MKILLSQTAQSHYLFWKNANTDIARRIDRLLLDISEHPFTGIGKPEMLRGNLAGIMSRRINHEHRLLYEVRGSEVHVLVLSMKYHYKV